jgi:hypothetical protein
VFRLCALVVCQAAAAPVEHASRSCSSAPVGRCPQTESLDSLSVIVASDLADRAALLSRFGKLFDRDLPAFVSNLDRTTRASSHEVVCPSSESRSGTSFPHYTFKYTFGRMTQVGE